MTLFPLLIYYFSTKHKACIPQLSKHNALNKLTLMETAKYCSLSCVSRQIIISMRLFLLLTYMYQMGLRYLTLFRNILTLYLENNAMNRLTDLTPMGMAKYWGQSCVSTCSIAPCLKCLWANPSWTTCLQGWTTTAMASSTCRSSMLWWVWSFFFIFIIDRFELSSHYISW